MTTPTTPDGLRQYDHLPAAEAARLAWTSPGYHSGWHRQMQDRVRAAMPVLARALDRLADEDARGASPSRTTAAPTASRYAPTTGSAPPAATTARSR